MNAIRGTGFQLPNRANSTDSFGKAVVCALDMVSEVPTARWDLPTYKQAEVFAISRVRHGGFMIGTELFHGACFSISAAEAYAMDPQQRLLLENAYQALHAAGEHKASLLATCVGLAAGITQTEYGFVLSASPAGSSVYASTGASLSVASGRLSYVFGLHGPCAACETACSSALVASHSATRALRYGECEVHVAVGVNMMLLPSTSLGLALAGMTSPTGRSHTFDYRADGFARGEGCGVAALYVKGMKTGLSGSAVRQDGRSASLTAPNGQAQLALLEAALTDAMLQPMELTMAETHGTGTALGDPIEFGSLTAGVLRHRTAASPPLATVGLKANSGHGESAAGLTGLIKLGVGLQARTAA
ncbi:MAG: polyketide synthase, partial [Promethearchaeia archaeon]